MSDHKIRSAPNYTNAALTMLGVNLIWCLAVVWALFGFTAALLLALALNHAITRLAARRT